MAQSPNDLRDARFLLDVDTRPLNPVPPTIITTAAAMRRWRAANSGSCGFVPTMGYLHDGHLELVRRSIEENLHTVVSIFVNPMQFGPNEDFSRYPRPVARDRRLLEDAGVDLLWQPTVSTIYPPGDRTRVQVEGLSDVLEGASRPGHYTGVATVVMRLLAAVQPDVLWLGQKDAQHDEGSVCSHPGGRCTLLTGARG